MNLESTITIHAGGPGSGCKGTNCGRPRTGNKQNRTSYNTVMVDFDNTIAQHRTGSGQPEPKRVIREGRQLVEELKKRGYRVIVLTARTNLDRVRVFLAKRNIPVDGVTNRKIPATAYIDDRGIFWDRNVRKALQKVKSLE